jgi:uncharacterized protein (TIGR02588 family)
MARSKTPQIPVSEWIVAGIGVCLVIATIALLALDIAAHNTAKPPAVSLESDTVIVTPISYLAKVNARNEGGRTAADLRVEGVLLDSSGNEVEKSEATLDFLPPNSRRELGLFFQADPRKYRLSLRATGYQNP